MKHMPWERTGPSERQTASLRKGQLGRDVNDKKKPSINIWWKNICKNPVVGTR